MQKVKTIFSQTLMISTAILFGIGILMFIQLPTYFLLDMDSLKKSEVRIRIGIHFVSVLGIVVLCASLFHWFGQTINLRIICLMYSLIYLFVWCATAWMAKADEIKINEAIKDLQDSE